MWGKSRLLLKKDFTQNRLVLCFGKNQQVAIYDKKMA